MYLSDEKEKLCGDKVEFVFSFFCRSFPCLRRSHRLWIRRTYVFFDVDFLLSKMASGQGSKYWPSIATFLCHSCPKFLVTPTCLQLNPIPFPVHKAGQVMTRARGGGGARPSERLRLLEALIVRTIIMMS